MAHNILSKIFEKPENGPSSFYGNKKRTGEIGSKIESAIEDRKQVKLLNYSSVNTNSIKDRIIEPHQITPNYDSVIAFEVESKLNKNFKLSRMEGVEILETPFQYEASHKAEKRDIFGFSGNTFKEIEIEMKLRACDLLKLQFPLSEGLIKEKHQLTMYGLTRI